MAPYSRFASTDPISFRILVHDEIRQNPREFQKLPSIMAFPLEISPAQVTGDPTVPEVGADTILGATFCHASTPTCERLPLQTVLNNQNNYPIRC